MYDEGTKRIGITVRFPRNSHEMITQLAAKEDRPLASVIRRLVEDRLRADEAA